MYREVLLEASEIFEHAFLVRSCTFLPPKSRERKGENGEHSPLLARSPLAAHLSYSIRQGTGSRDARGAGLSARAAKRSNIPPASSRDEVNIMLSQ